MYITVSDIMQLEAFSRLELIAGKSGLDNTVSKVGILDYEFSKRGDLYNPTGHWLPGEFVLTSMTYARDNTSLLTDAVKKLCAAKTSGIAIKNVYSLEIPHELRNFANQHRYPLFVFTDNSLYFESIIIAVHDFASLLYNQDAMEQNITKLLTNDYDSPTVIKLAREICNAMSTKYSVSYFIAKNALEEQKMNTLLAIDRKVLGRGNAIVRYHNGFFYIHSGRIDSKQNSEGTFLHDAARKAALNLDNFHIGVSETQYFIANLKKALLQSYYAAFHSYISATAISYYDNLGVYKLLLPYRNDAVYQDYYERIIPPLVEYDAQNNTTLLETVLLYEACKGNIKEMSNQLHTHSNTVRYRIKKAAEVIGFDEDGADFAEQISIGVKLHRIKNSETDFLAY